MLDQVNPLTFMVFQGSVLRTADLVFTWPGKTLAQDPLVTHKQAGEQTPNRLDHLPIVRPEQSRLGNLSKISFCARFALDHFRFAKDDHPFVYTLFFQRNQRNWLSIFAKRQPIAFA